MPVSISDSFNETVLTILESYALSEDKTKFIHSLPEGVDKKILLALLEPYSVDTFARLMQAGVPQTLAAQIEQEKEYRAIVEAKDIGAVKDLVQVLRKRWFANHYEPRPAARQQQPAQMVSENNQNIAEPEKLPSSIQDPQYKDVTAMFTTYFTQNPESMLSLSTYAIRNIDSQVLLNMKFQDKANIARKPAVFATFSPQFITKFILRFREDEQAYMKSKNLTQKQSVLYILLRYLSLQQINAVAESIPQLLHQEQFIFLWFGGNYTKRFPLLAAENKNLTLSQKQQKRKIIEDAIENVRQINTRYRDGILRQLEVSSLTLDICLESVNIGKFLQYVSAVRVSYPIFNEVHRINLAHGSNQADRLTATVDFVSNEVSEQELIVRYLQQILRSYSEEEYGKRLKDLCKYLDEKTLSRMRAKAQLAKGRSLPQGCENVLTEQQKTIIRDRKQITISDSNKKSYRVSQDVYLKLKIKNISKIRVKIYELNLQKHYTQLKTPVNDNIDLHFLDPTYQFEYEVQSNNPYHEIIYDMKLEEIKKARGVYVVDLDGDGLSSRAVIRKGSVFCLSRVTLAGLELKFYDEQGTKIDQLSIWLRGQLIKVSKSHLIPFGPTAENINIIAVVGDFAEQLSISIPEQNYLLQISSLYNEESLIVGSKAKIILSPRLYLNRKQSDYQIALQLLKNIRVSVLVTDYQSLNSTISFENVTWSYSQDYTIELPIQNFIRNISVSVTAQIDKYDGSKQNLAYSENIPVHFNDQINAEVNQNFKGYYLRRIGGKYVLSVLGMDGEKVPRQREQVELVMNWTQQIRVYDLESDQNGEINLGQLQYVAGVRLSNRGKYWHIGNARPSNSQPITMNFKQGEKICVPLPAVGYEMKIGRDVNLFRVAGQKTMETLNQLIEIKEGYLYVCGLAESRYKLHIMSLEAEYYIGVWRGETWDNQSQLYDRQRATVLQFVRNSNNYLTLGDATITKNQAKTQVQIKIHKPEGAKLNPNVKAHIFAYSFMPTRQTPPSPAPPSDLRTYKFPARNNSFLSNKKLSQQASYVLSRREQKQFIGNNLQKPHILLNRIKVRDTVQKEEVLQGGSEFQKQVTYSVNKDMMMEGDAFGGMGFGSSSLNLVAYESAISSHNNFLKHPGCTLDNIKSATLQFELPCTYNYISVVLLSNNSKTVRNYHLDCSQLSTRPIHHNGLRQPAEGKSWCMSRQVYSINAGESRQLSRSSKWTGVSLLNIIQYARTQGIVLDAWIQRWCTMTHSAKLDMYNRKACHELNSFVKHHDVEFFNAVVKPYIGNKVNKGFVDLCLLEEAGCENWAQPHLYAQLNIYEKVLLIEYLVKRGKRDLAEILATALQLKEKRNKIGYNEFKQKFDTMVNAEIRPASPAQFNPFVESGITEPSYQAAACFSFSAPPPPPGVPYGMPSPVYPSVASSSFAFGGQMRRQSMGGFNSLMQPQMPARMPSNFGAFTTTTSINQTNTVYDMFDMLPESYTASLQTRQAYQQQFKQVQKTQQFTQVTYDEIITNDANSGLIKQSKFWADLASHIVRTKQPKHSPEFISQSILYLSQKRAYTLAASFLPNNLNPDYQLQSEGNTFTITANRPFLLFTKQIKQAEYNPRQGLIINQRLIDPTDPCIYQQDGTQNIKDVEEFITGRQYTIQTLITNTNGSSLEVQLLIDLPEGAIPLGTKQYTQVVSLHVPAFSTQAHRREFYFPLEGRFRMYPANATWNKKVVVQGASVAEFVVKRYKSIKKLETLSGVMADGSSEDILNYIASKNVFDGQVFNPDEILWMLSDRDKYLKIIKVLKSRGYVNQSIWKYSLMHSDLETIQQFVGLNSSKRSQVQSLRVFEYFPYYSSRAHKYQNSNRSKIRNVQFKQTFYRFIFEQIAYNSAHGNWVSFKVCLAYFLLLQDRIDQASSLIKTIPLQQKPRHQLQIDYIECFLDMYEGFPTFSKARKIIQHYQDYPIRSWGQLFTEIKATLSKYDNEIEVESEQKAIQYKTTVIKEGGCVKLSIPANTRVQAYIYSVNLELMFSESPFTEKTEVTSVRPSEIVVFEAGDSRDQKIRRPESMKDIIVQIFQSGRTTFLRKVQSFFWTNPNLKVKINQKRGTLQVFHLNKPLTGGYCKVYSQGAKGEKFYRDGYTDITGTFKYALSELKQISLFSILCVSDQGGVVSQTVPPSERGEFVLDKF